MAGNDTLARRAVRAATSKPTAVRPHLQARPGVARQGRSPSRSSSRARDRRHPPSSLGHAGLSLPADDLLADLNTGHKVVATVFNECHAMYRARGPVEMKPVGEVEFCAGVAAMSDSGIYGPTRICAGIVGHADLTLGDRVAAVLEAEIAAGGGRFKGIRYRRRLGRRSGHRQQPRRQGAGRASQRRFRAGLKRLFALGLSFDAWIFYPPARRGDRAGARLSRRQHRALPHGRRAGLRPLGRQEGRGLRGVEGGDDRARQVPERVGQGRRADDAARRHRLSQPRQRRRPRSSWPTPGGPMPAPASSCSAPTAAWSRATSRSTRWASAMPACSTR